MLHKHKIWEILRNPYEMVIKNLIFLRAVGSKSKN